MKSKTKSLVYGVGINDADYVTEARESIGYVGGKRQRKLVWICPFYRTWRGMLERCYSIKFQERRPTYKGCSVCEDWLSFSNFKSWMETQDYKGKHLDKDLLVSGNKVYSPENCIFIDQLINSFMTERGTARGKWLIGVHWSNLAQKFVAQCNNPFTKKIEYLGLFAFQEEAHSAWLTRKLELAKLLAAEQDDPRVSGALMERYGNYV